MRFCWLLVALAAPARPCGAAENWFLPYEPDEHTLLLLHLDSEAGLADNSGALAVTASLKGTAGADEGMFEGGVSLDGAKGSLGVSADEGLRMGYKQAFTVEMWFRPRSGGQASLWSLATRYYLKVAPGTGTWSFGYRAASFPIRWLSLAGPRISLSQWHHVALVHDETMTASIYLDGRLAGSLSHENEGDYEKGGGAQFGSHDGWTAYFKGDIDEIRVSDVAREYLPLVKQDRLLPDEWIALNLEQLGDELVQASVLPEAPPQLDGGPDPAAERRSRTTLRVEFLGDNDGVLSTLTADLRNVGAQLREIATQAADLTKAGDELGREDAPAARADQLRALASRAEELAGERDVAAAYGRIRAGLKLAHNPAVIVDGATEQVYWGDIHGNTSFSGDGLTPIYQYIEYARDHAGLDFTTVTDHSGCVPESWIATQEKAGEYTVDGEFVALKGFEFSYAHGHRNVYFDNQRIEERWPKERMDLDGDRPFFEYLRMRKDELISIPHHTLVWTKWDIYDRELEPVCEVHSMWGCSERTVGEGNTLWDKSCIPGGGAQAGLGRGYRFGFIGSSDTHSGFPGRQYPDRYGFCFSYKAGLAAIHASELTAKALVDALKARSCYATTGARIYVEFFVNGHRMGSEIEADGPRRITGRVVGTAPIARIDVVRDNVDWRTLTPDDDDVCINLVDDEPIGDGMFYYLRVTQTDGEMAWASPVWVDTHRGG